MVLHHVLYGVQEEDMWGFVIRLASSCGIKIAYKVAYRRGNSIGEVIELISCSIVPIGIIW